MIQECISKQMTCVYIAVMVNYRFKQYYVEIKLTSVRCLVATN